MSPGETRSRAPVITSYSIHYTKLYEAYGWGVGSTISKGVWHSIELMATISDTAGEARLWLDGNLDIEATGKNLGINPVSNIAMAITWATPKTEANTLYIDDATICLEPMSGAGASLSSAASRNNFV